MLLIVNRHLKEEVVCSFVDGSTGASQVFSYYTTLETTRCFLGLHTGILGKYRDHSYDQLRT